MKRVAIGIVVLSIAGCASEFRVPVTGQSSTGEAAAGEAIARLSGKGEFWVKFPAGMRCEGDYDSLDRAPTIIVPVRCDNGTRGEAVVTRQLNGISGTAIVKLTNGQSGQFVFGDITYEQAFGNGGSARTR